MFEFTIAVCTYNPDLRLLTRLFNALLAIVKSTTKKVEIVIVDNNSSPPLSSYAELQDFLSKISNSRCIVEAKQGLAAARCAAIKATSAPIIVFFDDDNEPSLDYLEILSEYFRKYPNVGIWGPGQIEVEYIDPVEQWFLDNKQKFQQRNSAFAYVCEPANWGQYYPNGTGFALRREILDKYLEGVETAKLSLTGRQGNVLSSGEDAQIVWEGMKMGFAAGMIPELKCKHLIPKSKANFSYLKRLHFGTASAYIPALFESFPETKEQDYKLPSRLKIYEKLTKLKIKQILRLKSQQETDFDIAEYLGGLYGLANAQKSQRAQEILNLAKILQLL